jgi:hypothetical protein
MNRFYAAAHDWDIDNGCDGHYFLLPNDDAMTWGLIGEVNREWKTFFNRRFRTTGLAGP